jgi:5'-3' exonuclease
MGIPYYFYTVYKKYNGQNDVNLMISEQDIQTIDVEHLFFDYNSMIHPCAQQVIRELDVDSENSTDLEEEIIENCIMYTRYVMSILKPKNVYIMIDGVAPRAKMNQQRERRYKSRFLVVEDGKWDSNKITPGTEFMNKLRKKLEAFVVEMSETTIRISGADEPGEGEHKMMKYITENLSTESKKIFIYGLDADLIMLSLKNVMSKNIVLIRDNTFNAKLKESERTFTYLEISQLKRGILKELETEDVKRIDDYIMLCFLLGNDFLEHLPSLRIKENGVNVLLKFYKKAINSQDKYLVNNGTIDIDVLYEIFVNIGSSEDYFFKSVFSVYKDNAKESYRDTINLEEIQQKGHVYFHKDDYVKFNQPGYKKRYYLYYGILEEDVKELCRDYLEGLYWTLLYYDNHKHNNWSWFYKHHATPFASDVVEYLKNNKEEFIEYIGNTPSLRETRPCSEMEQLCLVLPRESLLRVTNSNLGLEKLFRTESPDIERMYPRTISVDLMHREYLWQSKLFIEPFIDSHFQIIRDFIFKTL